VGISIDEVRRIANLAKLDLRPEEMAPLAEQLGTILEHMDRLSELDGEGLPSGAPGSRDADALREDRPRPGLTPEEALQNAPDAAAGHFRVPRFLG
jgi:aspartyl-tRNA(Asn)/glutamyl-tRNA(Gln) amidotransferase subunit C